jgi:hypothetical protein
VGEFQGITNADLEKANGFLQNKSGRLGIRFRKLKSEGRLET